jgi:pSer/pThr/pTyr-binding forkhead associated (FHA) protein
MNKLAPTNMTDPRRPRLALRFISGKYQGGEFPLIDGQEIVIGRSSDLDMVLVEEMVSRRHARILLEDAVISIEDLGSTNGTFVNGEKIQKGVLKEGDRILIGTSILKVVPASEGASREGLEAVAARRSRSQRAPEEAPRMSGSLEEIPLPDLLQLFGSSRKSGVLVVRSEGKVGRIFLKEGLIRSVTVDGRDDIGALKAVYRMLEWRRGVFELDPPDPREFEHPIDLSAQEVLMEGFRQLDELGALKEKLPPFTARLVLPQPLTPLLRELGPEDLDLLQSVLNSPSLEVVFDLANTTDLDTARRIEGLLKKGYLISAEQGS